MALINSQVPIPVNRGKGERNSYIGIIVTLAFAQSQLRTAGRSLWTIILPPSLSL